MIPRIVGLRSALIGKQPLGSSQSFQDMITQEAKIPCRPTDPVSERGTIKLDALTGIDLCLPVKRQVIGILGDQHLGDQRFGGETAFTIRAGAGAYTTALSHERQP